MKHVSVLLGDHVRMYQPYLAQLTGATTLEISKKLIKSDYKLNELEYFNKNNICYYFY